MKGIIFIPDISGFTNFVSSIDIALGMTITRDLLNQIIEHNSLKMEISEIEGDAVLFYKMGKPIPLARVISSFSSMYSAFETSFRQWKIRYHINADLSLKLIVHYGNLLVYDIRGFKKLYGEAVIESHSLLKNGNGGSNYILVTEAYMKALKGQATIFQPLRNGHVSLPSQFGSGAKRIAYYFLPEFPARVAPINDLMLAPAKAVS